MDYKSHFKSSLNCSLGLIVIPKTDYTIIARLEVCRPTLKKVANACSHQANVLKFCDNIISTHRT